MGIDMSILKMVNDQEFYRKKMNNTIGIPSWRDGIKEECDWIMEFYYDTVLGLQYRFVESRGKTLILDISSIPENFDMGNFMESR